MPTFVMASRKLSQNISALLWQKEASHKSPKSEKVMLLDIGLSIFYFHSEFGAETLILLKDI